MTLLRRKPFRDTDEFVRCTRPDMVDAAADLAVAEDVVLRAHLLRQLIDMPRPIDIQVGQR
jgi:hypothetical protein